MASFIYTAREKSGAVNRGTLYAADRQGAAANLLEKGLTPILIKEEAVGSKAGASAKANIGNLFGLFKRGEKVKLAEKVVFARQFATMINAGVPIVQSLNILQEQSNDKTLKLVIADLGKRVQGGATLSSAMAEHPTVFSAVFVNMVRAGETGGILDKVLDRLASQQEKDAQIVSKVRGAMIYPAVITTVTIGAFFFMMTVIVPKMAGIFESFGSNLPPYTRFLLGTSKVLTHYSLFLIIGAVAAGIGISRYIQTPSGKKVKDILVLRVPIFGPIVKKVNIARFARTFGSLMASGISVLDALNTTASALGNSVYRDDLAGVAREVKNGKPLSDPLRRSKNFPPIVSQMTMVGEETGQLDEILLKLADFYETEVDNIISNITSIIEPVLIVVIGAMIGSIVIGVLGPLGSLTNSVG